jgi:hypothetical protein
MFLHPQRYMLTNKNQFLLFLMIADNLNFINSHQMALYIKRTNIKKHTCHNSCLKCRKFCNIYIDKTTKMFNEENPLNFKAKRDYQFSR